MAGGGVSRLRRVAGGALRRLDAAAFPPAAGAGEHWQRETMNVSVDAYIQALDPSRVDAAEVSGDLHAQRSWKSYVALDYPEFDVCAELTETRRFGVVICEQVLEHVPDPWLAARNLRELCAPGGHVIVSTPFLIKLHELPELRMFDYWRFTPRGLRRLLEAADLEVESIDAWGNRECVVGNFGRWSARRAWHSMRNEPDFPVQVWAFARRPD